MKKLLKALGLLSLMAVCLIAAGAGWAWWRLKQQPAYWQANQQFLDAHTEAELDQIASDVEARFSRLTRVNSRDELARPLDLATGRSSPRGEPGVMEIDTTPQQVSVTYQEANAWLSRRLPQWMANQAVGLPSGVSKPMVGLEEGRLVVAFYMEQERVGTTVSMLFDVEMRDDGLARTKLVTVRGGNLGVPVDRFADQLRERASSGQAELIDRLMKMYEGQVFEPVFPIDAKREFRVLGLKLTDSQVDLTVQTLPR